MLQRPPYRMKKIEAIEEALLIFAFTELSRVDIPGLWLRGQKQISYIEFLFSVRSASIAAGYIPRAQVPENSAVVKATREDRGSSIRMLGSIGDIFII